LYVGGGFYFISKLDETMNIKPFMAHAMGITVNNEKEMRMKGRKVWYLDEMGEEVPLCLKEI
jgi:hypothetical protein